MRHLWTVICIVWSIWALGPGTGIAQEIVEPSTKTRFPTTRPFLDGAALGPALDCVGTAVRKKFIFKVYGMCLYVDIPVLHQRVGDTADPETIAQALIRGGVAHAFVLHFVRNVDARKIVDAFREGLQKNWPDGAFDPDQPGVRQFLAATNFDIRDGQEIQIWIDAQSRVHIRFADRPVVTIDDPTLQRAITGIWLGARPVHKKMKASLLRDLPGRLRAASAP